MEERRRILGPKAVSLCWFKSYIGNKSNEEADKRAKVGAENEDPTFPVITKEGLKEVWKRIRKEKRYIKGTGGGRVVKWERKAKVSYVYCRTGKRNLQSWRNKLEDTNDPSCRFCSNHIETGKHVALICPYGEEIGQR